MRRRRTYRGHGDGVDESPNGGNGNKANAGGITRGQETEASKQETEECKGASTIVHQEPASHFIEEIERHDDANDEDDLDNEVAQERVLNIGKFKEVRGVGEDQGRAADVLERKGKLADNLRVLIAK